MHIAPGKADPQALPVADLARYLAGAWWINRRIVEQAGDGEGRLFGTAVFAPAPGGLQYSESGTLTRGAYQCEATQSYWYGLDRLGIATVKFTDGRHFHCLDLSTGVAEIRHDCAPDTYHGRYCVTGLDVWTLHWRIEGPRKRLAIDTRYRRQA